MTTLTGTITDGIGQTDSQVVGYGVGMSETFRTPDLLLAVRGLGGSITDGIGIQDVLIRQLGVIVAELLRIQDTQALNQITQLSLVDSIFAADAIARGVPLTITDGIGMQLVQAASQLISVIESLGLADVVSSAIKYSLSIAEALSFADALARFVGAGVIEGLQIVELLSGSALKPSSVTEGVSVHSDISSSWMVFRAVLEDGIDLTDAQLLQMIFSGEIAEAVEIAAAYLSPGGSVTTWAMNTRTHAVTEYTNYSFNSFARIGDKYLGATKDGLYNLSGDTDAGTSIIADIKSGFAQFAGVHLSSFKGAYIAARSGGSYVLKLFTGTGGEYHFSVTVDSMKTARVDLGKGIRARYFAFELISSGQDFDIDSLEFIPLIAKRRV